MAYISEIIDWHHYKIEVRFFKNKFKVGTHNGNHISHLEIECIEPARAPLPMTETGYRSHHATTDEILQYGDAVDFVKAWLEHEEKSDLWQDVQIRSAQLTLF